MTVSVFKIVSVLLSYPSKEIHEAMPEIVQIVNEMPINKPIRESLYSLASDIGERDIYDVQERYVYLFDRTRSLSLHLFEHVHGESRDRGQAMVDMLAMYEKDGFEIGTRELPDYLPMFLEFLSTKPITEALSLLGQTSHILVAIRERLTKRKSIYVNAFSVLISLAKMKPDPKLVNELLQIPDDDPKDLDALDKIWEEEVVTFGGGTSTDNCGLERMKKQIRAAQRRPPDAVQNTNTENPSHV